MTESEGLHSLTFRPDADVVEDFCSILSLLSRRLISPIVKTRERHPEYPAGTSGLGSYVTEFPAPILPFPEAPTWKPRPLTIITSIDKQEVLSNNPPVVGVDPWALSNS